MAVKRFEKNVGERLIYSLKWQRLLKLSVITTSTFAVIELSGIVDPSPPVLESSGDDDVHLSWMEISGGSLGREYRLQHTINIDTSTEVYVRSIIVTVVDTR